MKQGTGSSWFVKLQQWFWIIVVLGGTMAGVVALWGGLPGRVSEAEKKVEKVQGDVDDLKGWARETQGYVRAMEQQRQRRLTLPDDFLPESGSEIGLCWSSMREQWIPCPPKPSPP